VLIWIGAKLKYAGARGAVEFSVYRVQRAPHPVCPRRHFYVRVFGSEWLVHRSQRKRWIDVLECCHQLPVAGEHDAVVVGSELGCKITCFKNAATLSAADTGLGARRLADDCAAQ
jgi:hypothetical protein